MLEKTFTATMEIHVGSILGCHRERIGYILMLIFILPRHAQPLHVYIILLK